MPFGDSRVVSRTAVPEGQRESSPTFQRREGRRKNLSPEGTAERVLGRTTFQPSLRDLFCCGIHPSVETLGYSHLSLRDIPFRIAESHYSSPDLSCVPLRAVLAGGRDGALRRACLNPSVKYWLDVRLE